MKVAFNGVNREIVILPGVEQIDVRGDLYSDWKEWVRESDNAKYPAAFRTFGGDPTIEGQFAPSYFFLINNWKVIAEDISVEIGTNLYTENDPIVQIDNASVAIRNSDAATVDTGVEESLDYNGVVNINTRNGFVGTDYPIGTIARPVNNLADAIAIANFYGISDFNVRGDLTIDEPVENFNFRGGEFPPTLVFAGVTVSNSRFYQFEIGGNMSVADGDNIYFEQCGIGTLSGFNGIMNNCTLFNATLTLSPNNEPRYLLLADSVSGVSGLNYPIIEIPFGTYSTGTNSFATHSADINIRHYSGGIGLTGSFEDGSFASVDLNPGSFNLLEGVSGGEIVVRGIGIFNNHITDETLLDQINLDTSGFYYDVEDTTLQAAYNETVVIDTINGVSGTLYPKGTGVLPVNNLDDALSILNRYNLNKIETTSPLILDQDIKGVRVLSSSYPKEVTLDNIICENVIFENVQLNGTFSNTGLTQSIIVDHSIIGDLDNFYGTIKECSLSGEISIGENAIVSLLNCRSIIPGLDSPKICKYLGSTTSVVSLNIRAYSGGIRIKDFNNVGDTSTIEYIAGRANIDSSCVDGTIVLRGVGTLNNESSTASNLNLVSNGFIDNNDSDITNIENEIFRIGETTDNISQSVFNIGTTVSIIDNTTIGISESVFNIGTTVSIIDNKIDGLSQSISEIEDSTSGLSQSINSFGTTLSIIEENTNEILDDVNNLGNTISIIDNKIDGQNILLEEIAGLVQKNFRITNQAYDINGLLETATIRTFANSTDATNNVNPLYEYNVEANYDSEGKLIDYLVIDV